jgi:pilus assembly protein CpaB
MEAATSRQRPRDGLRRFLGTRRGSFVVAVLAAALAAVALVAYLNNYKRDVRGGTLPIQVLVADRLIPEGTSGDAVATDRLFRPTTIAEDDAKPLALADAAALSGKVATRDIFPGQQITSADFQAGGDRLRGALTGSQRAIAIPVDEAHGLIGDIRTGDKIDVFASFTGGATQGRGVLRTIAQDVLVLKVPAKGSGGSSGNDANRAVIVRLSDRQAARLAFAADNGKIWLALRPPAGGTQSWPSAVTDQSIAAPSDTVAPSSGSGASEVTG